MTAYIKAIATDWQKNGLAWHGEDGERESLVDSDNVTSALGKAGIENVRVVKGEAYNSVIVDGKEVRFLAEKSPLMLVNVPWTENHVQDLGRLVTWYDGLDNSVYAEILDPLTEKWHVGSVMHVGSKGETFAIQLRLDPFTVANRDSERHETFLLVSEDRLTGKKFFHFTSVRVVCANTHAMAVSGVKSLPNGKDARMMLTFRTALEQAAMETRQKTVDNLNRMFTTPVNNHDVDEVAALLFPSPKQPKYLEMIQTAKAVGFDMSADNDVAKFASEKERKVIRDYDAAKDRQEQYMKAFFNEYQAFNDTYSYAAQTQYAVWQAATACQKPTSELYPRTEQDVAMFRLFYGDRGESLNKVYNKLSKR